MEIMFGGKTRFITADQQQMLSLLISTYEAAVLRNTELAKAQNDLRALNERLEELVEKRTVALSEEITERKRAEQEICKLNEDLEQRIDERTRELRQSIAELEELNRIFVDRELKMVELKERIAELEKKT
jgi:hypothetical protein